MQQPFNDDQPKRGPICWLCGAFGTLMVIVGVLAPIAAAFVMSTRKPQAETYMDAVDAYARLTPEERDAKANELKLMAEDAASRPEAK